jgi:heme-degrading monooxygenase HmoA
MEARMVTLTPKPGRLDEVAAFWNDEVVAAIAEQQGNRGFVLLKDAANGRIVGLSLWDNADDANAAVQTFRSHMGAIEESLASPPAAAIVEVAAFAPVSLAAV